MSLLALRATPPAFTIGQACAIAAALFGVEGEIAELAGERDRNFLVRPAHGDAIVLKILGSTETAGVARAQAALLRHVARTDPGLTVPRVVPTREGDTQAMLLAPDGGVHCVRAITYQSGVPHDDVAPDPARLRRIGAFLARLDRALHGLDWARGSDLAWDPGNAARLLDYAKLIDDAPLRALVIGTLDRFIAQGSMFSRLRQQVIHNDVHGGNLLLDPDSGAVTGLIDFGDAVWAPLAFELAVPASELASALPPEETAAALLAGYGEVAPLDGDEQAALVEAILARHAMTLTVQAWRQAHDPQNAGKLGHCAAKSAVALAALAEGGIARMLAAFRRDTRSTVAGGGPHETALLARRRLLLGEGLELSYDTPVHFVRGDGAWLFDAQGRRFLDGYNNVPVVGHARPEVADAVAAQMHRVCSNTRYLHETVLEYAARLTARLPEGFKRCLFVNSGSEAVDAAWRLAKSVTGHSGALVLANAYHGITEAAAALSPYYGARAQPLAAFVRAVKVPDPASGEVDLAAALRGVDAAIEGLRRAGFGVAAMFVDSAFVSNGIADVPAGFVAGAAARVRAAGGLLVADEVQAGFGRMGDGFWGFSRHGVTPDVVVLGKPMANGHPVGAVVTRADVHDLFLERIEFFSTFGGNPVSAAAALATLDVIERLELQDNARATGALFRQQLAALAGDYPVLADIRGSGLMIGVEIVAADGTRAPDSALARAIVNGMRERHVLIGLEGPRGNVLKIRPPLVFGAAEVNIAVTALQETLLALPFGNVGES